jgi:hypothetical protein
MPRIVQLAKGYEVIEEREIAILPGGVADAIA